MRIAEKRIQTLFATFLDCAKVDRGHVMDRKLIHGGDKRYHAVVAH